MGSHSWRNCWSGCDSIRKRDAPPASAGRLRLLGRGGVRVRPLLPLQPGGRRPRPPLPPGPARTVGHKIPVPLGCGSTGGGTETDASGAQNPDPGSSPPPPGGPHPGSRSFRVRWSHHRRSPGKQAPAGSGTPSGRDQTSPIRTRSGRPSPWTSSASRRILRLSWS